MCFGGALERVDTWPLLGGLSGRGEHLSRVEGRAWFGWQEGQGKGAPGRAGWVAASNVKWQERGIAAGGWRVRFWSWN